MNYLLSKCKKKKVDEASMFEKKYLKLTKICYCYWCIDRIIIMLKCVNVPGTNTKFSNQDILKPLNS